METQIEYIEPTRAGRIKFAVYAVAGLAFALAVREWAFPLYFGFVDRLPNCDSLPWLRGSLLAVSLIPLALAAIIVVPQALKMLKHGQSPVPGTLVLVRTPVRRGRSVRWQAYALLACAALAAAMPFFCLYVISQPPLNATTAQCVASAQHPAEPSIARHRHGG